MFPEKILQSDLDALKAPKSKPTGHGGKRPGAGRKAPDGPRINFTAKIAVVTRERINRLKEKGVTIGTQIDLLVEDLCTENGIDL